MSSVEVYEVEVRHDGLRRVRQIRGTDKAEVDAKAKAQYAAWDQLWQRRQLLLKQHPEANKKEFTEQRNRELRLIWDQMGSLLRHVLEKPHEVLWESLKDHQPFPKPQPSQPVKPQVPHEPQFMESRFQPKLGLLDRVFPHRRYRKIEYASQIFKREHREWDVKKKEILSRNDESQKQYEIDLKHWAEEKREFLQQQNARNTALDKKRDAYLRKTPQGVHEYCRLVLGSSSYPKCFPRSVDLNYDAVSKSLTVEYQMPALDDLPRMKELHYDQLRDTIQEVLIPEASLAKFYERLLQQFSVRVLYELYEADVIGMLDSIMLLGWVETATENGGEVEHVRVVSVQAGRREFFGLNMGELEPKECLERLNASMNFELQSISNK